MQGSPLSGPSGAALGVKLPKVKQPPNLPESPKRRGPLKLEATGRSVSAAVERSLHRASSFQTLARAGDPNGADGKADSGEGVRIPDSLYMEYCGHMPATPPTLAPSPSKPLPSLLHTDLTSPVHTGMPKTASSPAVVLNSVMFKLGAPLPGP